MLNKTVLQFDRVPDNLLSRLEGREVALWILVLPKDSPNQSAQIAFLGLPWRLILSEIDSSLFDSLEKTATFGDPMTRKRGFVDVIDIDSSRIELPQRCLPIYLLNGRKSDVASSDFERRLRRMTMLEGLRRSGVRDILIVSAPGEQPLPPD